MKDLRLLWMQFAASQLMRLSVALLAVQIVISCSVSDSDTVPEMSPYREILAGLDWGKDTTFVYGHKTPDVDAVTSALSYASLMRAIGYNCKAKVSSQTNRESAYISKRLGFALPELKNSVVPGTRLILTDHGDYAQCVDGAREAKILQKIDHHVEGDIPDAIVPYVRREMVGSTCTIVFGCFKELGVPIDDEAAKIMLAGILSDTRNLTKTTTKKADSIAWKALVAQLHLEDQVAKISREMEEASYDYDGMTDSEILLSDYKDYEIGSHLVGVGSLVCKKTEMDAFISRMLAVMPEVMKQKGRDMIFAKIDNLVPNPDTSGNASPFVEEGTYFIYYGVGTKELAEAIFGPSVREGVTYTKENLSRKQIVPKIMELLK
jgi:manganese-dependent inorganic pyrophosphatase